MSLPAEVHDYDRRWRILLAGIAVTWVALLGWSAATIWWVEKNLDTLDTHVSWITKATALHHKLAAKARTRQDSSNRNDLDPATLADLRTGLWETVPDTVALTKADRRTWDDRIRLLGGADPPESEQDRLAAAKSVVLELEKRIGHARQRTGTVSVELNGSWLRLYLLAGIALIALGALAVLLSTIFRQGRSLRESQAARENRERRYRELVELSQDLIWSVNTEGRWTFLNHAANSVYGRTPDEMTGRRFIEFTAPERTEQDSATFAKVLGGEAIRRYETIHVHRDGSGVPMLFNGVALRDETGNVVGATGTATDISDITAMQDRLREDERLRSVGQLAGGVAHDFNNLLTGILGHLESIDSQDLDKDIRKSLDTIRNAATGGSRLTHQLLAFAGRQTLRPKISELASVGRDVHALLADILGDDIELHSSGEPGVFVNADTGQIEQALVNLVLNARDALPDGGTVKVSWARHELDAKAAEAIGVTPGSWACLEVQDDGIGMDAGTLARVFEPFFTTKPIGHGTGLGLPSAHGVVAQHGGVLRAKSAPNLGSTLSAWLPTCAAPKEAQVEVKRTPVGGRGTEVLNSVLLVEDDPIVREVIARGLKSAGYSVIHAENGTHALKLFKSRSVDVLVTDVQMPGLKGPELAERVRAISPTLPILFVSGFASAAILDARWLRDQRTSFLAKPFLPRMVSEAIDRLAARMEATAEN